MATEGIVVKSFYQLMKYAECISCFIAKGGYLVLIGTVIDEIMHFHLSVAYSSGASNKRLNKQKNSRLFCPQGKWKTVQVDCDLHHDHDGCCSHDDESTESFTRTKSTRN